MRQWATASSLTNEAAHPIASKREPTSTRAQAADITAPWSGNQSRLRRLTLQRKLAIGSVNDPLEAEADSVADRVMRIPDPTTTTPPVSSGAQGVLRLCSCGGTCASCSQEAELQRKHTGSEHLTEAPPIVHETLRSSGNPLDPATRAFMEPRFGRDFSAVRVHTDERAAESARQVNSLAYTVGNSIVFRSGSFNSHSEPGRRLLAHELTHVAQQSAVIRRAPPKDTDPPKPKPVVPPARVEYGSTPLSKKAIEIRRANRGQSGDKNLVVVRFSWRKSDGKDQFHEETEGIWNTSTVAHSEQELDQFFRNFKTQRGGGIEISVSGIFSERQFCGPSNQNCQQLIYKSYPDAEKEFAYNYQTPRDARSGGGAHSRNVIRQRIETFRDSDEEVDHSTRRDPPPYDETSGGRLPGQVRHPATSTKTTDQDTDDATADQKATKTQKPAQTTPTPPPTPPKPAAPDPATTTTPATQTPAKTKPAADPAAPAKTTTQAPAQTKPKTNPEPPAPSKPASKKPATKKPAVDPAPPTQTKPAPKAPAPKPAIKPAPPKAGKPAPAKAAPTKPISKPSAPAKSTPKVDPPQRGGFNAKDSATISTATKVAGNAFKRFNSSINQIVRENNHDKDLATALDVVDTAVDVHSFVENPRTFTAQAIKTALIQGVFDHFSGSLDEAQQNFAAKFPEVSTFHADPRGSGISLEGYEKLYNDTQANLRLPNAHKAELYLFFLLGTNEKTPEQEIKRRIALANDAFARLPDLAVYANQYAAARDDYEVAVLDTANSVNVATDNLASVPAGFADELRRRGDALLKSGEALNQLAEQLMTNDLAIFFEEIYAAGSELQTLGNGFERLGSQFHEFADLVNRRRSVYAEESNRLQARYDKINADRYRSFL